MKHYGEYGYEHVTAKWDEMQRELRYTSERQTDKRPWVGVKECLPHSNILNSSFYTPQLKKRIHYHCGLELNQDKSK